MGQEFGSGVAGWLRLRISQVAPVKMFEGLQRVKNLTANAGDTRLWFDPWVGKIPWKRKWQPTPVFLPREFYGQSILVGYSPQGRKESDTTK